MDIQQLPPGSPVELRMVKGKNEEKVDETNADNTYLSSLFDISKKGELIIHMPTKQGRVVTLPLNVYFDVIINTRAGLFGVTGTLTAKGKLENFPVYIFQPVGDIRKVQRREYFRLPCVIPAIVTPITREIGLLNTNSQIEEVISEITGIEASQVKASIVDISGGGARFNAKVDINTDSYMLVKFDLPTNNGPVPFQLVGRRVKSDYIEEKTIYEHRIEFIFKEREEREIIIKHIFDEERRIRKRNQG